MSEISPVVFIVAILLDIFGFICLILTLTIGAEIGESLSFIPDILGLLLIGGHQMFFSRRKAISQAKQVRKKALAKAGQRGGLKFLFTFIGELLPFIGAFPFWTIYVLSESKKEAFAPASA